MNEAQKIEKRVDKLEDRLSEFLPLAESMRLHIENSCQRDKDVEIALKEIRAFINNVTEAKKISLGTLWFVGKMIIWVGAILGAMYYGINVLDKLK